MTYKVVDLGSVVRIIGGGTPSKSNLNFYKGDIPWATVRDMGSDYLESTELKINEEAVRQSSTNIIPKNNVIIVTRVGLGKVSIIKQDTAINQDLRGIIANDKNELDTKYLFYWFKSISQKIIDAGRGATVHGVTLPFIRSLRLPLPNISEQRKIVSRFESLFFEIDKSIILTNKKSESLIQLKNATLKQSFNVD